MKYDIVVVGAGPAGSSTALFASRKGAKVLLIEKKRSIGVPVTCGELLNKRIYEIIDIPAYIVQRELTEEIVYKNDEIFDKNIVSSMMIDRSLYDKYLASKAVENGSNLLINTMVTNYSISNKGLTVKMRHRNQNLQITCDILVGADGFGSSIARWAGMAEPYSKSGHYGTHQYCMSGVHITKENCSEVFFGAPYLAGGFAWILPKTGTIANVGVAIHASQRFNPRLALDYFIKMNSRVVQRCKNAFPLSESSAPIHASGPLEHIITDKILLVGEAAGHVNPLTGEGNFYGLAGGKIAGTICAEAIEEGDFSREKLQEYEKKYNNEFGNELKRLAKRLSQNLLKIKKHHEI
jgi:digeranylgeranylglycerophospholipid reductase